MSGKNDNQQVLIEMKVRKNSKVLLEIEENNKMKVLLDTEKTNTKRQVFRRNGKQNNHKTAALLETETEQNCKQDILTNQEKENVKTLEHETESEFSFAMGCIVEEKSENIPLCHGNETHNTCCKITHTSSAGTSSWYVDGEPAADKPVMSGPSNDTWIVWSNMVPSNRRAKIFGVEDKENPGTYLFITATNSNELALKENTLPNSVDQTDPRVLEYKRIPQTWGHTISKTIDNVEKYVVPETGSGNLVLVASHPYDWRMNPCNC